MIFVINTELNKTTGKIRVGDFQPDVMPPDNIRLSSYVPFPVVNRVATAEQILSSWNNSLAVGVARGFFNEVEAGAMRKVVLQWVGLNIIHGNDPDSLVSWQ